MHFKIIAVNVGKNACFSSISINRISVPDILVATHAVRHIEIVHRRTAVYYLTDTVFPFKREKIEFLKTKIYLCNGQIRGIVCISGCRFQEGI